MAFLISNVIRRHAFLLLVSECPEKAMVISFRSWGQKCSEDGPQGGPATCSLTEKSTSLIYTALTQSLQRGENHVIHLTLPYSEIVLHAV